MSRRQLIYVPELDPHTFLFFFYKGETGTSWSVRDYTQYPEVARYAADVRRRLAVKPGMTGLWQVSGRSDLPWEEAVRLDLRYVENWSLSLDLVILLRTMTAVIRSSGAY